MPGNVELGHHADTAIVRVGDKLPNLRLRVKHVVRAHPRQLGELLALGAESLVVGKMPVQHVHLYRRHSVNIALKNVDRNKVATDVDQHAAPREARLVFDGDGGSRESRRSDLDQLKKRLQPAQDAKRGWRCQLRPRIRDPQFVGFVLAKFLHRFAAAISTNLQRRRRARLGAEWNPGLAGKLRQEPLNFAVQRAVVGAGVRNRERLRDDQLPAAQLDAGRHGHQVQLSLRLSSGKRRQEEE